MPSPPKPADAAVAHPIAEMAIGLMTKGQDEPYRLADADAARLVTQLRLLPTAELRPAIQGLVSLAYLLEQKKSPGAAQMLLMLTEATLQAMKTR